MSANEQHALVEAISTPDKAKWQEAMEKEMKSLHSNEVWKLVETPPNRRIVGSKWIFKRKFGADGTVQKYKARLVAQGCTQIFGLDYEKPLVLSFDLNLVRSIIALGAQLKLQLHQMDVSTAFLHGELQEEVYMRQSYRKGLNALLMYTQAQLLVFVPIQVRNTGQQLRLFCDI